MAKVNTSRSIRINPRQLFGRNLTAAMAAKEMSVNGLVGALAPSMSVDARLVKRWRAGDRVPRLDTIFLLAEVLDVTPGWFFDNQPALELAVAA